MVSKFLRSRGTGLLVTGAVLAGIVFLADRFNLGTQIAFGARSVGQSAGDVITQPIAGLTETLTGGINDIRLQAQGLFEQLAAAGADVQEGFTGDRDAIGNFFDNIFPSVPLAAAQPSGPIVDTAPPSSNRIAGVNFSLPDIPQFRIFNQSQPQNTTVSSRSVTPNTQSSSSIFGPSSGFNVPQLTQKVDLGSIFGSGVDTE